ncbi:MAG: hypothetical protein J0L92_38900, partial [Deltaproteobacteria bacterium]|nr:hypothetical protein [Deltaproteobacteria bacterium]
MTLRASILGALVAATLVSAPARVVAQDEGRAPASEENVDVDDRDAIPDAEIRLLPEAPCERLTMSVAISALDRRDARASCLASVRMANRQDRIDEGVLLLGLGVLSAIAGGVTAGIGANDGNDFMLSFGLGTAGWGVINAAFSLALFDVSGSALADIDAARG